MLSSSLVTFLSVAVTAVQSLPQDYAPFVADNGASNGCTADFDGPLSLRYELSGQNVGV